MAVGVRRGEEGEQSPSVVEGVVVCLVAGCGGEDGGEFGVDEVKEGRMCRVGAVKRKGYREVVFEQPVPVAP